MKHFIQQKLEAVNGARKHRQMRSAVAMTMGMVMSTSVFAAKTGTEFKTVSEANHYARSGRYWCGVGCNTGPENHHQYVYCSDLKMTKTSLVQAGLLLE